MQTRANMSMVYAKLQQGHPRQILVITTPRMYVMDIRSVNTSMVYANQRVHQGHLGHPGQLQTVICIILQIRLICMVLLVVSGLAVDMYGTYSCNIDTSSLWVIRVVNMAIWLRELWIVHIV